MNAITIARRDPAVIAARAHHVLDSAARMHADWPTAGRRFIGESFLNLDESLAAYGLAVKESEGVQGAAETCAIDMGILLLSVAISFGKDVSDEMARNAAEVTA